MRKTVRNAAMIAAAAASTVLASSVASAQNSLGQSFTVGAGPNTLLSAISVGSSFFGSAATPFTVSLFALTGSATTGSSLFSQSLGTSFNGFSLTPNVNLTAGQSYVLLVNAPVFSIVGYSATADFLPNGSFQQCPTTTCAALQGPNDIDGFSFTLTRPTTTAPEPSTWALSGAGLLAIAAAVRRRQVR